MRRLTIIAMFCILFALPILAQDETMPEFETVELTASDDLVLSADFYLPDAITESVPTIILLHMLGGQRGDYDPFIPYLLDAGYAVLNVDMRGHGATGGSNDWDLAIEDMQGWFDWLREQEIVDPTQTAIVGASIGSNVGLIACANDTDCVTAVALSPGEDYRGVMPGDAIANGLNSLLIASHGDRGSANSVRAFFAEATGVVSTRLYLGTAHGTRLFNTEMDSVATTIINWLNEQFSAVDM